MAGTACGQHRRFTAGCKGCQRAGSAYDRRRRRMIADGTWLHPVPAQAVRDHIAELRAAGMTVRGIARAGNLASKTVSSIVHDRRSKIQGPTAAAILAVRPRATVPAGFVAAIGTTRRVRAMVAFGYSLTDIARRLDKHLQMVWEMAWERQAYVAVDTHQAVADLYERLSTNPGPSVRARNTGRRNNWALPLAWDDIDDPDATPCGDDDDSTVVDAVAIDRALDGVDLRLTSLERHHAVHVGITRGLSLTLISDRVHASYDTVKALAAKPLPAGYELVA